MKMTDGDIVPKLLGVIADLLRGTRHSRRTLSASTGRSLPTADRWIEDIAAIVPRIRRVREGRTSWIVYDSGKDVPTKTAAVGACIAASLGSLFEGSQQERNLKDARDYLLRLRGENFGDLDRKFFLTAKGGEYALPEKREELDEIVGALLGNNVLRFKYRHNSGVEEDLQVEPLSLVISNHQFYVLARRPDSSLYTYRFARMNDVDAQTATFVYPTKIEYDPKNVFASVFGIHISVPGPPDDVEVVLSGPWANYATMHRWHPSQQARRVDDGHVVVSMRVHLCPEVETWLLAFGEHAQVTKPMRLKKAIAARLRSAAGVYAMSGVTKKSDEAAERKRRGPRRASSKRAKIRRTKTG
jgi:predicted DNA-binding transcriptional regulator YafY